jgi:hypothetical protein
MTVLWLMDAKSAGQRLKSGYLRCCMASPNWVSRTCDNRSDQDLRNHGDTGHAVEHTYSLMAEDVRGFMLQHRLDKTVLIGHSMCEPTPAYELRIESDSMH